MTYAALYALGNAFPYHAPLALREGELHRIEELSLWRRGVDLIPNEDEAALRFLELLRRLKPVEGGAHEAIDAKTDDGVERPAFELGSNHHLGELRPVRVLARTMIDIGRGDLMLIDLAIVAEDHELRFRILQLLLFRGAHSGIECDLERF